MNAIACNANNSHSQSCLYLQFTGKPRYPIGNAKAAAMIILILSVVDTPIVLVAVEMVKGVMDNSAA